MDANGSPRARPGLRFANRIYENSPLNPNKRSISTPQTAPSRRTLTRDEPASRAQESSSLTSSIGNYARNIFSMSSQTNSSNPATTPFSPKLPAETKTKVFAPGSTPASKKVYREVTAQASPRGMATATAPVELFTMRIPSPPPEYTGKKLAEQIPSRLDSKGTVYADEFLQHLVPAEYDDLQRRQLFCILDLRRLKYSANEIFAKKDWKINITAFAKEYEKSRSLIMVRYGLYEWKGNAKPAPSVMRKWRKANGLPEIPDDEVSTPVSSKSAVRGSKRKADDDISPDDEAPASGASKRQAFDRSAAPSATPAPSSSKRKASVSEDSEEQQPAKKSSSTKAMFEQSWNKKIKSVETEPAEPVKAAPKPAPAAAATEPPKSNPFAAMVKPVNGGSAESVLTKGGPPDSTSKNIFGHVSDNSAQNSGQDADTESEADEEDEADTQNATQQSDEPSVVASGGVGTPQPTASIFGQKALVPHAPSAAASRESTPGRSLFDRVQQGADGQPLRDSVDPVQKPAAAETKPAEKPVNATWTPDTPIKFGASTGAPAPAASNLFGASTSSTTSGAGLFGAAKPAASSGTGLFGVAKPADAPAASSLFGAPKTSEGTSSAPASASSLFGASKEPAKSGGALFGAAPAQDKPVSGLFGVSTSTEPAKPAGGLFGAAPSQDKPASSLFGAVPAASKPASTLFGAAPSQDKPASGLFGAKPAEEKAASEADKSGESDKENEAKMAPKPAFGGFTPKPLVPSDAASTSAPTFSFGAPKPDDKNKPAPSGLFGASAAPALGSTTLFGASKPAETSTPAPSEPAKPLFGAGAPAPASNLFGGSSAPATGGLFGQSSAAPSSNLFGGSSNASKPPTPSFTFGATAAPTSPAPSATPLFGASPMKQDDKQDERPTKRTFGGSSEPAPAPTQTASSSFTFGQTNGQSSTPAGGLFGSNNAPQANGSASASFTFGGSSAPAVNNPFGSNGAGNSGGSMFAFGAGSSTPAGGNSGASSPFTFGAGAPAAPSTSSASPFQFGGASSQPSAAPAASSPFQFGGASQAAPSLNFTSASPQPQSQGEGNIFAPKPNPPGGSMFNLQPPGAGASTSGTNSPFNFGGASSLATTPATGTPEPTADRDKTSTAGPKPDQVAPGADGADESEDKPHEQISLTSGGPGEEDEEVVHEVRCKVLKFVPAGKDGDKGSGDDTPQKNKSPWQTQGVGPFRLLRHETTGTHRMLVRAEPRGHVVLNRSMLPNVPYTAEAKYVKMATSNETGDGLETWMIQVKNADIAKELAKILEDKKKGGDGEAAAAGAE